MAEVLISCVLDLLLSVTREQADQKFKLVRGVDGQVKKLQSTFRDIGAVIEDADTKQFRDRAVKEWLDKLKDVSYDIDDVLDEWNTAILKLKQKRKQAEASGQQSSHLQKKVRSALSNISFNFAQVGLRLNIANKIKELNGSLDVIADERQRYSFEQNKGSHEQRIVERRTGSVFVESKVFAREEDVLKIKEMLLCESSQETTSNLLIISILGMGGIGKTTLARLVYHDTEVENQFDAQIWICVSDHFEEKRIATEILESLFGQKPNLDGMANILKEISNHVSEKKILLVLDDVWTPDPGDWEQLKDCLETSSPGSRILVTTRKPTVADGMGCGEDDRFFLGKLSEEKCWSLFCNVAFSRKTTEYRKNLEDIGRKIVQKCDGLPLAVKVVAGLLYSKETRDKWQRILDSEMWEIEEVEERVFGPLLLSYEDMSPVLRQCFSYCAVFPKDFQIEKEKLICLWMAQGFLKKTRCKDLEVVGEEYFDKLAMLSFFQDFKKDASNAKESCKMHDIVHDFAQFLTAKECLSMDMDRVKESRENTSFENIRHLTILGNEIAGILWENWKKIRTLLITDHVGDLGNILNSIDHLTCLRALEWSWSSGVLTDKIGTLTHLRYLNLSRNRDLHSLPEAICDLYNLQCLDISACSSLKELPLGMGKLINLVYLFLSKNKGLEFLPGAICNLYNLHSLDISWCSGLRRLPLGMFQLINLVHLNNEATDTYFWPGAEQLTRLRTLKKFVVSSDNSLDVLGKLTHLQGDLTIIITGKGGKKAQLSSMSELHHLALVFREDEVKVRVGMGMGMGVEYESMILETLEPPPYLENFELLEFSGPPLLPNWMMSLTTLKSVTLCNCYSWETFPPLGKLPSLEKLQLEHIKKVKKVGREFLGTETSSSSNYTAFPKLNRLEFLRLVSLEEWEYTSSVEASSSSSSCCVTIMPCLRVFVIAGCPKLKMLPPHILHNPAIQLLDFSGATIHRECFRKGEDLCRREST